MERRKRKNDELEDPQKSLKSKLIDVIIWLPSLTFMALVAFYLLASLEVGHLPTYANPDPKDTIFAPFMNLIWIGIFLSLSTVPFGIVFTIFHFVEHQSLVTMFTRLALYILPLGLFFVLNYYSPVMLWFVD